ncbi:MAG: class I SAM-dependent methyltransferase [Actinomycetota bacterium]
MDERLRRAAEAARGFMPPDEGIALYEAARAAPPGPFVEVGSYCGKSAVYLGAAARASRTVLYSIDHHRGSEEHQPGEEYHDPGLVDAAGRVDTFPEFRRTIEGAGLSDVVVPIVARSAVAACGWATPVALLFVDGGHSQPAADADYAGWSPHVAPGGLLAIHDVFEDPADGGRPPYVVYRRAIDSGTFAEVSATGSLRVLTRVG